MIKFTLEGLLAYIQSVSEPVFRCDPENASINLQILKREQSIIYVIEILFYEVKVNDIRYFTNCIFRDEGNTLEIAIAQSYLSIIAVTKRTLEKLRYSLSTVYTEEDFNIFFKESE